MVRVRDISRHHVPVIFFSRWIATVVPYGHVEQRTKCRARRKERLQGPRYQSALLFTEKSSFGVLYAFLRSLVRGKERGNILLLMFYFARITARRFPCLLQNWYKPHWLLKISSLLHPPKPRHRHAWILINIFFFAIHASTHVEYVPVPFEAYLPNMSFHTCTN